MFHIVAERVQLPLKPNAFRYLLYSLRGQPVNAATLREALHSP